MKLLTRAQIVLTLREYPNRYQLEMLIEAAQVELARRYPEKVIESEAPDEPPPTTP